eukprot:681291_1
MASNASMRKQMVDIVRSVRQKRPNKHCADCGEPGPQYLNITFSTFVCTGCSGIHREFNHRVKSISMSSFSELEVKNLASGGNDIDKKVYLAKHNLTRHPTPRSGDTAAVREWIRSKYIDKRWFSERRYKKYIKSPRDSDVSTKSTRASNLSTRSARASERSESDSESETERRRKKKKKKKKKKHKEKRHRHRRRESGSEEESDANTYESQSEASSYQSSHHQSHRPSRRRSTISKSSADIKLKPADEPKLKAKPADEPPNLLDLDSLFGGGGGTPQNGTGPAGPAAATGGEGDDWADFASASPNQTKQGAPDDHQGAGWDSVRNAMAAARQAQAFPGYMMAQPFPGYNQMQPQQWQQQQAYAQVQSQPGAQAQPGMMPQPAGNTQPADSANTSTLPADMLNGFTPSQAASQDPLAATNHSHISSAATSHPSTAHSTQQSSRRVSSRDPFASLVGDVGLGGPAMGLTGGPATGSLGGPATGLTGGPATGSTGGFGENPQQIMGGQPVTGGQQNQEVNPFDNESTKPQLQKKDSVTAYGIPQPAGPSQAGYGFYPQQQGTPPNAQQGGYGYYPQQAAAGYGYYPNQQQMTNYYAQFQQGGGYPAQNMPQNINYAMGQMSVADSATTKSAPQNELKENPFL